MEIVRHVIISDLGDVFLNWEEWMANNPDVSEEELNQFNTMTREEKFFILFGHRFNEWMVNQKITHTKYTKLDSGEEVASVKSYLDL